MAKAPTMAEMEQKFAALERKLASLTGHVSRQTPDVQADYIEFGSDQHASHIGLRKAKDTDTLELDGWTLEDFTIYGPNVSPDFLVLKLSQKVSELNAPVAETQSVDPRAPNFAPAMFDPRIKRPFSQTTE